MLVDRCSAFDASICHFVASQGIKYNLMEVINYEGQHEEVTWQGISFRDGEQFHGFLTNEVAKRLGDEDLQVELSDHLRGLASTGFEMDNLANILNEDIPEERDWAIGEAVAEVWLSNKYGVLWPWNMERDKRTPLASLPGADLVGFIEEGGQYYLALGEVKSSSQDKAPPDLLYGKSGMTQQLESLATDKGLLCQLIKWLWPRCRNTAFQSHFDAAVMGIIQSENSKLRLFGVLIRDTSPNELDLKNRAITLSKKIISPANCCLAALYLPFPISQLPVLVTSREGL